jgi:hypothetical protein
MGYEIGITTTDDKQKQLHLWYLCGWEHTEFADSFVRLFSNDIYYSANSYITQEDANSLNFEVEKLHFINILMERLRNDSQITIYANLQKLYELDLDDFARKYFDSLPMEEKLNFYLKFYFENEAECEITKYLLHQVQYGEGLYIIEGLYKAYQTLTEMGVKTAEFYISY